MKTKLQLLFVALALFAGVRQATAQFSPVGTAFTYQGRLNNGTNPANGSYDFTFLLFGDQTNYLAFSLIVTNSAVVATNGLFTTTIDFGNVFAGNIGYWLQIAVRTNGTGVFTNLAPRQRVTPTPQAVYASTAGTSGTANGFSGSLAGDVTGTQSATAVGNVGGQSAVNVASAASAANAATSANTLNTIVKRDGSGNFSAGTITASFSGNGGGLTNLNPASLGGVTSSDTAGTIVLRDGSGNFSANTINLDGNLNLPATTTTAGIIYAGGSPFIHAYGSANFFAGVGAGNLTMTGPFNTGVGYQALLSNTGGSYNAANGYQALYSNTDGSDNTANGYQALYSNTSSSANTANGEQALYSNTSGNDNTASGAQTLYFNTSGNNNTASGLAALYKNTSGNNNTANGYATLYNNTSGSNNTANGYAALYANFNGYENVANGYQALYSNTHGSYNTANGNYALFLNQSGNYNTANGFYALYNSGSSFYNTADGAFALYNGGGIGDAAVGYAALYLNGSGNYNTGIGYEALYNNNAGSNNVGGGASALFNNTYGSYNTAYGYQALFTNALGNRNIAVGYLAGSAITGDLNIDIGNTGISADAGIIRIGSTNVINRTYMAGIYNSTISVGTPVYVNSAGQLAVLTSSARFKQNIQTMGDASDALLSLRPVTYHYKTSIDPDGSAQFGLVAEEVDKVNPDLVVHDDQHGIYTVRYEAVNAMLLNEFLKQHRKVEEQNTKIQTLEQQNDSLAKRLNELESAVKSLAQPK